jgi:hypothetical protein
MRAGVYAAMGANCSRVLLYKLALTKAGHEVLDVGIYQNRHWKVKVKTVSQVAMVVCVCVWGGGGTAAAEGSMGW